MKIKHFWYRNRIGYFQNVKAIKYEETIGLKRKTKVYDLRRNSPKTAHLKSLIHFDVLTDQAFIEIKVHQADQENDKAVLPILRLRNGKEIPILLKRQEKRNFKKVSADYQRLVAKS